MATSVIRPDGTLGVRAAERLHYAGGNYNEFTITLSENEATSNYGIMHGLLIGGFENQGFVYLVNIVSVSSDTIYLVPIIEGNRKTVTATKSGRNLTFKIHATSYDPSDQMWGGLRLIWLS